MVDFFFRKGKAHEQIKQFFFRKNTRSDSKQTNIMDDDEKDALAEAVRFLDLMTEQKKERGARELLNYWMAYRRTVTGRFDVDRNHWCTWDCHEKGNMCRFIPGRHAYGCLESGAMHDCKMDVETCKCIYTNSDGQLVCIYSSLCIGTAINRAFYNPARDGGGAGYGDRGDSFHNLTHQPFNGLPETRQRKRWKGMVVTAPPLRATTTNKRKRQRRRKGPISLSSPGDSGAVSSHRNGQRGSIAEINNMQILRAEVEGIIGDLIWNNSVRFHLKQDREEKCMDKAQRLMRAYVEECINDDPPVRPRTCDWDRIWNTAMRQARPRGEPVRFVERTRDLGLEAHYVHIVLKMWHLANSVESRRELKFAVRFRRFAVGLLYAMAKGPIVMTEQVEPEFDDDDPEDWMRFSTEELKRRSVYTHVILEKDEWLAENLPLPKELCYYHAGTRRPVQKLSSSWSSTWATTRASGPYSRSDITKGGNHIQVIMQEYQGDLAPPEIRKMLLLAP